MIISNSKEFEQLTEIFKLILNMERFLYYYRVIENNDIRIFNWTNEIYIIIYSSQRIKIKYDKDEHTISCNIKYYQELSPYLNKLHDYLLQEKLLNS